ncbi:MAG: AMP-binding protein [Adlercreutzia equolifaciens]
MIDDLKINETLRERWYAKGYWTHDTIADIWQRAAVAHPDREYVCDDTGSRLTYGEVDDKAGRVAAWLIAGIKASDVVTLQFPTWAEFTIVYVAVLKVGGVVHPVPRNYNDVDLEYAMNLVGSRAYLSPTFSHNTDYEAQILSVRDAVPTLAAIAVLDKQAPSHSGCPTFDDIYERFEPLREPVPVSADSVACILPTSGTTGKPSSPCSPTTTSCSPSASSRESWGAPRATSVHALALEPPPPASSTGSSRRLLGAGGRCCSRTSDRARPSSS